MKYINTNDVVNHIKHIMVDMDMRQKDICNATGWSAQTVSNLLACRRDSMNIDTLAALCDAINCDLIIDIVPRDDDNLNK